MEKSITIDDRPFYFSFLEGEVMSVNKHSTTRVTGHGGGGAISTTSISGVSGNIRDINISSTVDTETEIWLKDRNDKETRISLKNTDIPCRQGHRVACVIIGDDSTRWISSFINFNARKITRLISNNDLFEMLKISDVPAKTKRVGLAAAIAAFTTCTVAGFAFSVMKETSGPLVLGTISGLIFSSMLTKRVEIPREPGYIANTKAFEDERDNAENWAMNNLYDPKNADFSYLTPAQQHAKTPQQIEAEQRALKEKRKSEGKCTVCGVILNTFQEQAVGYCSACKTK